MISERGEARKIDVGEKYPSVASRMHPDWESNLQPFGIKDDTLTNEATLPRAAVGF